MSTSKTKCRTCEHPLKSPVCSFCDADQRMPFPKAILPANKSGRHDVKLKYPPRKMWPFHAEGVTIQTTKYSVPFIGQPWTYDLIAVPMETVRRTFKFKRRETPKALANLQIWINNLGQALYNPVTWRLQNYYASRPTSPQGVFKQGLYVRQYDGTHRIRALEALDFDFVYLFFSFGFATMSKVQRAEISMLFKPATRYRGKRYSVCGTCKGKVQWKRSADKRSFSYKCPHCGHTAIDVLIYPEPI